MGQVKNDQRARNGKAEARGGAGLMDMNKKCTLRQKGNKTYG